MASRGMTQVLGSLGSWVITGQSGGRPITGKFTDADTPDAKVYRGDSQAVAYTPDVSWADSDSTKVRLVSRPDATSAASITPGAYRIEIGITPVSDGIRRVIHSGTINFTGTSGSATPPYTIASWTDVLLYSSDVKKLEQQDTDQTQFSGQRAEATGLFLQEVIRRYNPRPGGSRRLLSADGLTSGSYLQFAPSPDGSPPPSRAQVAAWLADPGRLALNRDIVEACARLAAALVYGSSPGQNNPYQQMADKERSLAARAVQRAVVEIDAKVSPDGTPTIRVDRDVVYLT